MIWTNYFSILTLEFKSLDLKYDKLFLWKKLNLFYFLFITRTYLYLLLFSTKKLLIKNWKKLILFKNVLKKVKVDKFLLLNC